MGILDLIYVLVFIVIIIVVVMMVVAGIGWRFVWVRSRPVLIAVFIFGLIISIALTVFLSATQSVTP